MGGQADQSGRQPNGQLGSPTRTQSYPTIQDGQAWNNQMNKPVGIVNPMTNYGSYGAAPPGMDPNVFNRGTVGRTSGGEQGAAFDDALGAYKNTLGGAQGNAADVAGQRYGLNTNSAYQNQMGQQQQNQAFAPGQLFQNNMDPLVQQQMSRAQQDNSLQARSIANQVGAAAGDNKALAGALRGRGMQQAMLANNSLRPEFMAQQNQRDLAQRQASETGYGLNMQGIGANNQTRQAGEQLNQGAYGQNVANAGMQNQSSAQQIGAYTGAAAPQNNLVGMLGSQLPSFGNQWDNSSLTSLGRGIEGGGK